MAETEQLVAEQTAREERAYEEYDYDYKHPGYRRSLFEVDLDTERVIIFWDPTIYGRSWSTEGREPAGALPFRWRSCLRCGSVPEQVVQPVCTKCWLTSCDCDG